MTGKLDINITKDAARLIEAQKLDTLVLCKSAVSAKGREWTVTTKSDAAHVAGEILAEGAELGKLLSLAANGKPMPPQFASLATSRAFKELGRLAGLEKPALGKFRKVADTVSLLVKGSGPLIKAGMPFKLVQLDYLLREVVLSYSTVSRATKLPDLWRASNSHLSFADWQKATHDEWSQAKSTSQTNLEFMPWLETREWEAREKRAWQTANPNVPFTEDKLVAWKVTQYDPNSLLAEPKWLIESFFAEENEFRKNEGKPPLTYVEYVKEVSDGRKEFWTKAIEKKDGLFSFPTIDDALIIKLCRIAFEWECKSGSDLSMETFVAKEIWKETNPADQSDRAFIDYVDRQQYTLNPSQLRFEDWKADREEKLKARHTACRINLPYETWKKQQVVNHLVTMPFVRLNVKQREAYRTDCVNGILMRNNAPFSTALEKTNHSGQGWVIFVIGPHEDLYTASHLSGVFHHSSFLGNRAVASAGEIKTDAMGKITHISAKSGHYRPGSKENIELLKWFKARGVDLSQVEFTCFLPEESLPVNAQAYLDGKVVPIPKPK